MDVGGVGPKIPNVEIMRTGGTITSDDPNAIYHDANSLKAQSENKLAQKLFEQADKNTHSIDKLA